MYKLTMVLMALGLPTMTNGAVLEQIPVISDIMWAADTVEVPRTLLLAICYVEGRFKVGKKLTHMDGHTLSHGTCQIKLGTAQFMDKVFKHKNKVTADKLEITRLNAFYAAKYLKYQLNRYKGNWWLAADAYNKHNAVSKTSKYVIKVQNAQTILTARLSNL